MKKIILIGVLFSVSSFAVEQPKYLEGATVTVTLKNGKKYTYDSKKMAVVPRTKKKNSTIIFLYIF